MPRSAKPSASASKAKVRTLDAQVKEMSETQFKSLLESVFPAGTSTSGSNDDSASVAEPVAVLTPPASPKKRKQSVNNTDIDSVVVPGTPSPKKKKSVVPVVDSPVIRALEGMMAPDIDTPRPVRVRQKTEKALANEASQSSSGKSGVTKRRAPPTKDARLDSPIELTDTDDDLPMVPRFASTKSRKIAPSKMAKSELLVDDDVVEDVAEDEYSERLASTQSRKIAPSKMAKSKSLVDDEAVEDDAEDEYSEEEIDDEMKDFIVPDSEDNEADYASDHSAASVNARRGSIARALSEEIAMPPASPLVDNVVNVEIEIDENPPPEVLEFITVMNPSIQEEMMKPTYVGLPVLDRVFHTRPYHYDADGYLGTVPFANIRGTAALMSEENAKSFFACLSFVSTGRYINAARAAPNLVIDYKRRMCLAAGGQCVLMTVGLVSAAHLVDSSIRTGGQYGYDQHRLTIVKFQQEAIRENAFIAQTFNMYSGVLSTTSNKGFSYVTRGSDKVVEERNAHSGSSSASHLNNAALYTHVGIPAMPILHSANSRRSFIEFNELVPILDGRAETGEPFRFRFEDFDRLGSWRSWERHQKEIPLQSVVSIGYGASHFEGRENGFRYLVPNILFVIILHIPSFVVGLADEQPPVAIADKPKARAVKGKARAK
ncbi:hypothetical protein H0H93_011536 [Arthromyces matolae]|nr:hypothetical protein H0H93_011536 [Arthromyces matolae]